MSFFDRFTSKKGKEQKSVAPSADKKAFAAVPSGKEEKKEPAKKVEAAKPAAKKLVNKETTHRAHRVLLRAAVTEKSTMLGKLNQYVFMVDSDATKVDVRHAVQHVYGIQPINVSMVRLPGKIVRYGRSVGRTNVRKKAVVTLPAGKTIDLTVS